MNQRSQEEK